MSERSNREPEDARAACAASGRKLLRRILRETQRAAAIRAELDGQTNMKFVRLVQRLRRHIKNVDRGAALPSPSTFLRLLRRLQRVPYGAPQRWIEAAESIQVGANDAARNAGIGASR